MKYVGIKGQQSSNNWKSVVLLIVFPVMVLALTMLFMLILYWLTFESKAEYSVWDVSSYWFMQALPWVLGGVGVWFIIAFLFNTNIINRAAGSKPLERTENKRVYNLVENLCMTNGMPMPKVNVMDSPALNAFASGINDKTYTVTLTTGIIDTLNDDELEGVIAHELTHIRNRDVRLLIVSIVFVGIFTLIMTGAFYAIPRVNGKNSSGIKLFLLILALLAAVGTLCSNITKLAISRKREYMADAGAAEMTRKPLALANALRKISGNSEVETVKRADVAQLFIEHGANGSGGSLFATHPPIERRIEVLEQF